ncbi:MAG: LA_2272 family surface repeat-containing protein, partial [Fusobacteriaceae bacterium]
TGLQLGSLNIVDRHMLGAQFGLVNLIGSGEGVQVAAFNKANSIKGIQFGFVNYTERLQGIQIGFVNMAKNSQIFEVLPLVNFNLNF